MWVNLFSNLLLHHKRSHLLHEQVYFEGNSFENVNEKVENILPVGNKFNLSAKNIEGIRASMNEVFAGLNLSAEDLAKIVPSEDIIRAKLADISALGADFNEFSEPTKVIRNLLNDCVQDFIRENPDNPASKYLSFHSKRLIHGVVQNGDSPLVKAFKLTGAKVLDDGLIDTLRTVSKELNLFKARTAVLDKYAFIKAAQAPETSLANGWNQVQTALFKALKFTPEEISKARLDGELASEVLRNKLELVTADKEAYATFLSDYKNAMNLLFDRLSSMDMAKKQSHSSYKDLVDGAYKSITTVLGDHGFQSTIDNLVGFGENNATSSKALAYDFISDRVKGVKSSFYRFLNMADMYYKISHPDAAMKNLLSQYPREVKEELVELAKITMLEGHNSDFAVKFWQLRNPSPNMEDMSDIVVKGGKVINEYFGKHEPGQVVELANDNGFYKSVMKMMFGESVHADTLAGLEHSGFKSDFLGYRSKALSIFGGEQYIWIKAIVKESVGMNANPVAITVTGAAPTVKSTTTVFSCRQQTIVKEQVSVMQTIEDTTGHEH